MSNVENRKKITSEQKQEFGRAPKGLLMTNSVIKDRERWNLFLFREVFTAQKDFYVCLFISTPLINGLDAHQ